MSQLRNFQYFIEKRLERIKISNFEMFEYENLTLNIL